MDFLLYMRVLNNWQFCLSGFDFWVLDPCSEPVSHRSILLIIMYLQNELSVGSTTQNFEHDLLQGTPQIPVVRFIPWIWPILLWHKK